MIFPRLAVLLCIILPLAAQAAPRADLWASWAAHDDSNKALIDHSAWDNFLHSYVHASADGINRVAYASVAPRDKIALDSYVQKMQAIPISRYSRAVQRAYWINLYNATTVKLILDHYPVSSILKIDISPGLFSRGPWDKKLLRIENKAVSLNDIEHRILRPIWHDPRTHYSVNCASLSCPNLATRAYTAASMEAMLDAGARAYVNSPRGAEVKDGKLIVSSIYVWYQADFGGTEAGVIAHLRQYAAPALKAQLADIRSISDDRYDWSLNGMR
ncbi:MAG: DUF547 domain-containing protein [Stenotrophobium sp.]